MASTPTAPDQTNALEVTVSELSGKLKRMVEVEFGYVRVRGELGRISRPASGHVYLDLKDERAVVAGVIWKGAAAKLKHQPEEGLEVIATGKMTTYPGQSKYQLVIDQIEPAGAGALMALLEERRKKLAGEGLFDDGRKQLLPYLPRVIGVVTSPSGAVIRDILHRIADRFPLHVIVWPVRVQGETCGPEVANAVHQFNSWGDDNPLPKPDLLIVARGGGSLEDLWGFNDERAVRAVAASHIPVISAIGHETDWTLIDLAADYRAPTPTGAAEKAVPVRAELEALLADLGARLQGSVSRLIGNRKNEVRSLTRGLASSDMLLAVPRRRFDDAAENLQRVAKFMVQSIANRFEGGGGRFGSHVLTQILLRKRERLGSIHQRPVTAIVRAVELRARALKSVEARLRPEPLVNRVDNQRRDLGRTSAQLNALAGKILPERRDRLDKSERLLRSLSYKGVLDRGYAVVRDGHGAPLAGVAGIPRGHALHIEMRDGQIGAIAGSEGPSLPQDKPVSTRKAVPKAKPSAGQGDLF